MANEVLDASLMATFKRCRTGIADALTWLLEQDAKAQALSVTFQSSLEDAIFDLDTSPDIVDPYRDGSVRAGEGQAFSSGILQHRQRVGKLQQIRDLRVTLFGGTRTIFNSETGEDEVVVSIGVFDVLKELPIDQIDQEEL